MTDFLKFHVRVFFENLSIKFKFNYNLPAITGTLHADRYTFMIISRSVLLRMRNVSDKSCTESQITYFVFCNISSPKSCCLWDNVGKYGTAGQTTGDNVTRRMHIACWVTKVTHTHTHSEYVILMAFPLQQWLHECSSMLCYTPIAKYDVISKHLL